VFDFTTMFKLTRREFLKLGLASLGALLLRPSSGQAATLSGQCARIATTSVSVYREPSDKSEILFQLLRDEVVNIYEEIVSPDGPDYNPRWYRVWGGYIHTAHVQKVEYRLNPALASLPDVGLIGEITVPMSQSMRYRRRLGWEKLYRLHYQSVHWVVGIDTGPDGDIWYQIRDKLTKLEYFIPAAHLRPIPPDELTPLSVDVPAREKHIAVSIERQTLHAYEGDKVVLETSISSGMPNSRLLKPGDIPTETPKGEFYIQSKTPSRHMGDGTLTADPEAYELPGVPWVCFFEPETGVAFHGTYWHDNFGSVMSHGCVNMPTHLAKWLYRWTTPVINPEEWYKMSLGTRVVVS